MSKPQDYIELIEGAERRMFSLPFEVREEGNEKFFEGTVIRFNDITDLGYFSEEVEPGAFDEVLNDDVRCLVNHDPHYVLGRNKSGTMVLTVDGKSARFRTKYNPDDPDHVKTMQKVKRGDISQCSYAFQIKDATWEKRNGKDHRRIQKFKRWFDVGPVTYPANNNTEVAMRSLNAASNEGKNIDQAKADQDLMKMEMELLNNK